MEDTNQIISDIIEDRNLEKAGFKLLTLKLAKNPLLGDLHLNFCDNLNDLEDFHFTTVIIGPNGTGKSNILRTVIDIFRELNEVKTNAKRLNRVGGGFAIVYLLNGIKYSFGNLKLEENNVLSARFEKGFWFLKDEAIFENYNQIELPSKIIANSMMVTDKYPYLKEGDFPNYKYLGVRSSRASSGTKAYIRKTVDIIKDSLNKDNFIPKLKNILIHLELEESIEIYYKPIYAKEFYQESLTVTKFHDIFSNQKKYFPKRKTKLWGTKHYENIKSNNELIASIVSFLYSIPSRFFVTDKNIISYDVMEDENLAEDFKIIEELTKLDLISYPSINLKKKDSAFDLAEGSSGEYSLLSSLIGLMATVEENSLVFIDEPEVSLHPNWQMKYMNYLKDIFKGKKSCHFIIATHSHFLVSDIELNNSQIIGLKRGTEIVPTHYENLDTYAWTPDEVLYKIFDVVSSRNSFVADKIAIILDELSNNESDLPLLEEEDYLTLVRLKSSLNEIDPLKKVVVSILNKLDE